MKRTFTENQLTTIKELLEKARRNPESLLFHYSAGNSKLPFFNFGMPAVITCAGACHVGADCTKFCYALQSEKQYTDTFRANYENMLLFKYAPETFKSRLIKALTDYEKKCKRAGKKCIVRLFESGDILNIKYGKMIIDIIKMFPGIQFYGYTKQYTLPHFDFINELNFHSLTNCNLMLSAIDGVKIPETLTALYNVAYTSKLDGAEKLMHAGVKHCPGDCSKCHMCINRGHNVFFIIHGSGNYDYIPEKVAAPEKRGGLIIPVLSKYENTSAPEFHKTSAATFQGINRIYCKMHNIDTYGGRVESLLYVYELYRAGKIIIYKNGITINE